MTTITKIELINQSESQYVASLSKEKFYENFPRKEKTVKGSGEKELNNSEYHREPQQVRNSGVMDGGMRSSVLGEELL